MAPSRSSAPMPHKSKWKKRLVLGSSGLAVIAACLAVRWFWPQEEAAAQRPGNSAQQPAAKPQTPASPKPSDVMAVVNGERITREELGAKCLERYGSDVLDSLINKALITSFCQSRGIQITDEEINAEITQIAQRFRVPVKQWLAMLEKERGIPTDRYRNDIILPTLALRKVAQDQMAVSAEEVKAAYDSKYGPSVQARLIVCDTPEKARMVHGKVLAAPQDFGKLAAEYSDDPNGRAWQGRIPPIRMHVGDPRIEQAAYALKAGEVSQVIKVDKQFVILLCEQQIPPQNVSFESVREQLTDWVREQKEPLAAAEVFKKLRANKQVLRPFDDAEQSKRYPGVAAFVDNKTVTIAALADECVTRHGGEILEGIIGRRLLEQNCRKNQITVTKEDIDREIVRAATAMGITDSQERPDINRWLTMVEDEQGLTPPRYVDEIVWPTVALKKLVHKISPQDVEVNDEDIDMAVAANYGPRAKCRAIVLNNQRTAQEVWEKASQNPTPGFFGQLAYQYSVDPQTRHLHGEVAPIQKFGGKPLLEKEAFSLKQGELSGIVQVGDKFVILLSEGYTEPKQLTAAERKTIEGELYRDLYEKKLRIQMAVEYQQVMDTAQIDNYLLNTTQAPAARTAAAAGGAKLR